MDNGWISLYRSTKNKSWYTKPDHIRIWIHLLIRANHKEIEIDFHGESLTLKPGEFITGRKKLSEELKINESKVERVLSYFEKKEAQIEQRTDSQKRIITILNWDRYQKTEQRVNNDRTTSEQRVNTDNKDNKDNKKSYSSKFEKIWNDYPKRAGKKNAYKHFQFSVKTDEDFNNIKKALINYLNSENVKKGFIQNGSTWFNNWKDYINWEEPVKKQKDEWRLFNNSEEKW